MKKTFYAILSALALLCLLAGCSNPNALQLDLSQGYGRGVKLLHLNASTEAKRERIEALSGIAQDAQPLDKELAMFAYYPDYRLAVTAASSESRGDLDVIVDINGEFVDFYDPAEGDSPTIYRSKMSAEEFRKLVHWVEPEG